MFDITNNSDLISPISMMWYHRYQWFDIDDINELISPISMMYYHRYQWFDITDINDNFDKYQLYVSPILREISDLFLETTSSDVVRCYVMLLNNNYTDTFLYRITIQPSGLYNPSLLYQTDYPLNGSIWCTCFYECRSLAMYLWYVESDDRGWTTGSSSNCTPREKLIRDRWTQLGVQRIRA